MNGRCGGLEGKGVRGDRAVIDGRMMRRRGGSDTADGELLK